MIKEKTFFLTGLIASSLFFISISADGAAGLAAKNIELSEEAVFKKVTENGLTILVKTTPPHDLASIDIRIRAGSSLEEEYSGSGISHFVEHMVFKGTRTRKAGDIEREVKSYGGLINGATSQDLTSFQVTVPSKNLRDCLHLLKDMLLDASFESGEFERERDVILKEIRLNNDEPQSAIVKLLYETAYIKHPYKYPVIGYEEEFKRLKREDLIKYYNRMYVPNRIVVTIVGGNGDENAVISSVENEFKDFRPPDYRIEGQTFEPLQIGKRHLENAAQINLSYLALGFHSTSLLDKDLFAMDVLSMILGRGDNSRLNTVLFKEKGLIHSISSWNYTPRDPGLFVITALLDKENLDSAGRAIFYEIENLRNGTFGDKEVESAKRMALADYIFSRQTLEEEASGICENEILTGNFDFARRYVDGIQAVSKEDLRRVANKYLVDDNLTVVRLVPAGFKADTAKPLNIPIAKGKIKKDTLPNGLRVLLREDRKTPSVSISLAISGGLSAEDRANNGISNLAARMLLKGTASRKENEIKGALESLGGTLEPFSGFDSFGINLAILKDDIDLALEIMRDILTNSVFPEDELDKEKALLLSMVKEEDDDIFKKGFYVLRKSLFVNHPYGLRLIGEEWSIKALTRDSLLNFYKTYCAAGNIVLSISGDIESEPLMEKIKEAFKDLKGAARPSVLNKSVSLDSVTSQAFKMDRDQSLIMIGFKTTGLMDPDRYALDILGSILSGSSGRLFSSLRGKRSLAYTLGCVQKLGVETGFIIFYAATTNDKISETRKALIDEIKSVKSQTVKDAELILAKRELDTSHKMDMETNDFISFQTALDELYGLGYDNIYKYEKGIEGVTGEDVKRVANKYLGLGAYAEIVISSQ